MKRFRLNITDKFEDRPRLLTAYGRVKGGEIGLVIRPLDHTSLLVHITKDSATIWENHEGKVNAEWPRVRARLNHGVTWASAVALEGDFEGKGFKFEGGEENEVLDVALDLDNRRAHRVSGDAPHRPTKELTAKEAVALIQAAQKDKRKRGPATLRGQWAGVLICDDGKPRVELRRKLASYGWLRIHSAEDGWHWRFERQGKWFTGDAIDEGGPYGTLAQAIDAGVAGGMGLVREACGVRDTQRKTATEEPPSPAPVPRGRTPRAATAKSKPKAVVARKTSGEPKAVRKPVSPKRVRKAASAKPSGASSNVAQQDQLLMEAFARALDQALVV